MLEGTGAFKPLIGILQNAIRKNPVQGGAVYPNSVRGRIIGFICRYAGQGQICFSVKFKGYGKCPNHHHKSLLQSSKVRA
jgi:hypothetical protein